MNRKEPPSLGEAIGRILADPAAKVGPGITLAGPGEEPIRAANGKPITFNGLPVGAVDEAAWQKVVIEMAELLGWVPAHFRKAHVKDPTGKTDGRYITPVGAQGKGFPDLLMIHSVTGNVLVAELKREKGKVRPDQRRWLALFGLAEIPKYVWRPRDWPEVQRVLTEGAR